MIAFENETRPASRASLNRRSALAALGAGAILMFAGPQAALAASAAEIEADGRAALAKLYAASDKASEVGAKAKAILIFPKIVKAGLIVGGQSGDGVLLIADKPTGYYNIRAASFGLQAGAQSFSYVLFLMSDKAISHIQSGQRWDFGSGPSLVLVDEGVAKNMNTLTLSKEVYAFPFGQKGLMGGLGLEGTTISQIEPKA